MKQPFAPGAGIAIGVAIGVAMGAALHNTGAFTFHGIPPGDYKVFAWEAIESFGYFDENLLRQSDPQGATVRIEESAREQVEVRIIPARFQ